MGFFLNKKEKSFCAICGKKEGKIILKDALVCKDCFKEAFDYSPLFKNNKDISLKRLLEKKEYTNQRRLEVSSFIPTICLGTIKFNDNKNELMIPQKIGTIQEIYQYKDIINFELIEDGKILVSKGGLGRAIAGGVLFGGVGAIVGGVTGKRKSTETINKLIVRLTINTPFRPIHRDIIFINSKTNKNSNVYSKEIQEAKDLLAKLEDIKKSDVIIQENSSIENSKNSIADELIKLKSLLDSNILTKEEFNKEKEKLLNN